MPYAPSDPAFADAGALSQELERVATICHGCRLCVGLCPSFPLLFDRVDAHDGDVAKLTLADHADVSDACFDCKRCYVKCPYTPPHAWNVDFPALVLRERAVRRAREGFPRGARTLAQVDRAGRRSRWLAPLVNLALRLRPFRWLLEKALGIHRDADLPRFRFRTFAWFWRRRRPPSPPAPGAPRVALFPTCYVNYNEPRIGNAAAAVLAHNGVDVACPEDRCCGMPFLDAGDLDGARAQASKTLPALAAAARDGRTILACQPTCTYMLQREWPLLLPGEDSRAVAGAVRELGAFLMDLERAGKLKHGFREGVLPPEITYHYACHLQALATGPKSAELLRLVPGVKVNVQDRCSGHDGTYAFRKDTLAASLKVGARLAKAVDAKAGEDEAPGATASDCPLAARQLSRLRPARPPAEHPMVLLARAYGLPEGTA
jgi:Fe-S oxidoreductase